MHKVLIHVMEGELGTTMDPFTTANQSLINSLQQDNKNLRDELTKKEEDLHLATCEIARMSDSGESASEQFLIASLTSSRKSIAGLDLANQELLEAVESAQAEVLRLSSAGMVFCTFAHLPYFCTYNI